MTVQALEPVGDITEEPITITAQDDCELAGLWVTPPDPRIAVLLQAGTGFPKEYYRRFARAGAERGAACLLYDYRGIGGSAPPSLRGSDIGYTDWGRLDAPAAIDALCARYPSLPTAHIGHSVGGHFIGFAPNHDKLHRHVFLCVGTGYWRYHAPSNWPLELFFWWAYGPACLALFGYIPEGGAWGGAALPRGAFTTWRRWCNQSDYFLGELEDTLRPHHFDEVTAPITSFIYSDDPIANARTSEELLHIYPNAPRETRYRSPADYGLKAIGHNGPFSQRTMPAWREIWDKVMAELSSPQK